MASGAFINPKAALLATPLVSATCSLLFAADQDFFLGNFTLPSTRERSNALLPAYMTRFFWDGGLARVLSFLGVTTWASAGAIYAARPLLRSRGALGWYAGAAALAVAHLGFIPAVAWKLQAVMDDKVEAGRTNVEVLGDWLRVNHLRMWTTDLGAWVCAFVAVTKTLSTGV